MPNAESKDSRVQMKYKTIEYAVRARPGRDEWIWTIYPENAPTVARPFTGTRGEALTAAQRSIDRWLTDHRTPAAPNPN
jgi:hypothetical protein